MSGGNRTNTTHDLLGRAFKLEDAIHLYHSHDQTEMDDPIEDDCLSSDNWHELSLLQQLLTPVKKTSPLKQFESGSSQHGNLHHALETIE